jgi:competence protein ComFC
LEEKAPHDRLYVSYLYESPVGEAIRAFKFDDLRALGGRLGGLFDIEGIRRSDADLVVPIPLTKSRMRSRGFNQSQVLAKSLSNRLELRIDDDVLERLDSGDSTLPQSEQPTADARHAAMTGAFSVRPNAVDKIAGSRILLVDDIYTTGSTVKAGAAALKTAGASWVGVVALAVQPLGGLK